MVSGLAGQGWAGKFPVLVTEQCFSSPCLEPEGFSWPNLNQTSLSVGLMLKSFSLIIFKQVLLRIINVFMRIGNDAVRREKKNLHEKSFQVTFMCIPFWLLFWNCSYSKGFFFFLFSCSVGRSCISTSFLCSVFGRLQILILEFWHNPQGEGCAVQMGRPFEILFSLGKLGGILQLARKEYFQPVNSLWHLHQ